MMRGVVTGALVLAGLETVLSSSSAAQRTGGLLTGIGGLVDHFLDPSVPAIPDLRGASSSAAAPAAATASPGPAGPPRHAPVHSATTGANGPTGPGI